MNDKSSVNRRHFLKLGIGVASASVLAACGGQAAPSTAASSAPAKPSGAPASSAPASAKPAASTKPAAPAQAKPSAAASPASSAGGSGTQVVKIATVGSISDAGFYLADDRGYLKEIGLSADFQRAQSGPQMVPSLATGQIDVAGGSTSGALFSAIQRGIALRIVADKGSNEPGFTLAYIIVRKDLENVIKTPADLKGRKIAISSTDNSGEYFTDKILRTAGLTIKDVETTILGYGDQGAGLANKAIDAGQNIEPFATQLVAKDIAAFMPDKDKHTGFQAAVLMYGPKFVEERPEVGKKLMVAYLRGVRDYTLAFTKGKDKEDVIKSLISHTTVKDRALYDKMGLPGLNPDGAVNEQEVAAQQDFFIARGYQKEKLDLKPILDHQFVDYALSQLGKFSA